MVSLAPEDDLLAVTAALLRRLPPHCGLRQLLNVVNHAVKIPLRVDLGAAAMIQTG